MSESLQKAIVDDYYQTTVRAAALTREHFEFAATNLERWLTDWLPRNNDADCLDLACGCGEFLYLLQRRGLTRITGVDLCKEELNAARPFLNCSLVHRDILAFLNDAPSQSLDLISCLNILEHLDNDTLFALVKQCHRTLKPGGALIAMVPNAVSPFAGMTRYYDLTHQNSFTPPSIVQLARTCGFHAEDVSFRECGPRAHGVKSAVRMVLWKIIRLCIALYLLVENASAKDRIYTSDMLFRIVRRPA